MKALRGLLGLLGLAYAGWVMFAATAEADWSTVSVERKTLYFGVMCLGSLLVWTALPRRVRGQR